MDKRYYNALNNLHREVFGDNIDREKYNKFIGPLRVNFSQSTLQTIKTHWMAKHDVAVVPPQPTKDVNSWNSATEIIFLEDNSIKTKHFLQSVKSKKILVIGLIKNISKHFSNLKKTIDDLANEFGECKFYFTTNNNTDTSEKLLRDWISHNNNIDGTFHKNSPVQIISSIGQIGNRTLELAKLRNVNFKDAKTRFGTDFDYLMILDTDIIEPISSEKILSCFRIDKNWDMITSNTVHANSEYYYDAFALRLPNQPDDINQLYPLFKFHYGRSWHWNKTLYIFDSWYKVKSAFGGIGLLKQSALHYDILWDESIPVDECEHLSLCRKFANIYVNPSLKYNTSSNTIEGKLYEKPFIFLPRDSGLLSVFNFYVGSLVAGSRVYPYFNLNTLLLETNNNVRHFCYLTPEKDNCWNIYFENVKFCENDATHEAISSAKFSVTHGENAPAEFRIPISTKQLFLSENFNTWRSKIHRIFRKYIKFSDEILRQVDDITKSFSERMIGVHFRHPSHSCESGAKYFADYFSVIDNILNTNPKSKIFLATDTDLGILGFTSRYPGKIIYNPNVSRTDLDNILKWGFAQNKHTPSEIGFLDNTGYELQHQLSASKSFNTKFGTDVLTDVLCITKCTWFVCSLSNISLAVSYINPTIDMRFL